MENIDWHFIWESASHARIFRYEKFIFRLAKAEEIACPVSGSMWRRTRKTFSCKNLGKPCWHPLKYDLLLSSIWYVSENFCLVFYNPLIWGFDLKKHQDVTPHCSLEYFSSTSQFQVGLPSWLQASALLQGSVGICVWLLLHMTGTEDLELCYLKKPINSYKGFHWPKALVTDISNNQSCETCALPTTWPQWEMPFSYKAPPP